MHYPPVPPVGLEPTTPWVKARCIYAIELRRRCPSRCAFARTGTDDLPLSLVALDQDALLDLRVAPVVVQQILADRRAEAFGQ